MTDAESTQQEVEAVPQRFNGRVQGRLGYVCVGVPWFDVESAEVAAAATMESLATDWEIVGSPRVLTRCDQADEAMRLIAGMNVDCLVLEVGTFPDGDVIASIATKAHVPIVIHYVPDTFQDGLVERNAMCGAALAAYCVRALGGVVAWCVGDTKSNSHRTHLVRTVRGAAAIGWLRRTRLGAIGRYPSGFLPSSVDDVELRRKLGVTIEDVSMSTVTAVLETRRSQADPPDHHRAGPLIALGGGELDKSVSDGIELWYSTLLQVIGASGSRVVALKDWPELLEMGVPGLWPAIGWLQDAGLIVSPEGDLNGALTMGVASCWTTSPSFLADLVDVDSEAGTLTLWHYGCAESLARNRQEIRYAEDGEDVQFTLAPGRGTLLRLGRADGEYRLLVIPVEVVDEEVQLRRAACKVKPIMGSADDIRAFMFDGGWDHHACLVYGDVHHEASVFARCLDIELCEPMQTRVESVPPPLPR